MCEEGTHHLMYAPTLLLVDTTKPSSHTHTNFTTQPTYSNTPTPHTHAKITHSEAAVVSHSNHHKHTTTHNKSTTSKPFEAAVDNASFSI